MSEPPYISETEPRLRSSFMRRLMHRMAKLMPADAESGENARAVAIMRRMQSVQGVFSKAALNRTIQRLKGQAIWPVTSGAYLIGEPKGSVAICTLTSIDLLAPLAKVPGVAIVGRVYTPNLGIEKIILNVTTNPAIRFLLLCGKESVVFQPGQSLRALCRDGVTAERRIIGALGHFPVLVNLSSECIQTFRQQIELVDCTGETNVEVLQAHVQRLVARKTAPYVDQRDTGKAGLPTLKIADDESTVKPFMPLRPGGRRQPLSYDPKGFYVITLNPKVGEIVLRHYTADNSPAHEMRGRSAEAILLGLIREDLISQMSHAGYLGYELAKAETALRLGLQYEQDQPLRAKSA